MMKKALSILLSALLLVACVPLGAISVSAQSFEVYEGLYYFYNGDDIGIYGVEPWFQSSMTTITIPATIEGKPVTTIYDDAFWNCSNLTSVTLSENMLDVGERTFTGNEKLMTITVNPDNPKYCSVDGVLFNKKKTTLYVYPSAKEDDDYVVPTSVTNIQERAFYNCDYLSTIILPQGITTIKADTFLDCDKLISITIPVGVSRIDTSAFGYCDGLQAIHVEQGNAYYSSVDGVLTNQEQTTLLLYPYGKTVDTYTIPSGITEIDARAFEGCIGLSSVVVSDGVTDIERYAFSGSSLSEITLPEDVFLSSGVFAFCDNLKSVTLYVYGISDQMFDGCNALVSVTFGNTITYIGNDAFRDCYRLTEVYFNGTEQDKNSIWIGENNDGLLDVTWHYNYVPEKPAVTYGDLNADGEINNRDLVALQQYLNGWDVTIDIAACDCNADGEVNNRDLVLLQQYLNGWDITFGK